MKEISDEFHREPVPGVQIVEKGAKNRATARRTASEKKQLRAFV